jgi:tetratricopeptide (TPR) repeat protein
MTSRATFKDLIRARMAKTGESYSIAKRNVEVQCLREDFAGFSADLLVAGRTLSEAQVASLEQSVEKHPSNISARIKLMGYYSSPPKITSSRSELRRHGIWFLKNHPEVHQLRRFIMFVGEADMREYEEVRQMLFKRLASHPDDFSSLRNAAAHVQARERELSATLFAKAHALAPGDWELAFTLGKHLLLLDKPQAAHEALERSLAVIGKDVERFHVLGTAASAAFLAGELAKSARHADELLALGAQFPTHWNHGNAVHEGHSIRGLIALEAGKLDEASAALLEAGKTPGSPQLNSFGPNLRLARELAKRGQTSAVLTYFELCAHFWKMGKDRLKNWAAIVESGGVPDFGPNLRY